MDIKDIILFIIVIINIILGSLILLRNPRDKINLSYALTVFSVAFWTLGISMFRLINFEFALFWAGFYYISASLIATYFLYFAIYFPKYEKKWNLTKHLLLHLPSIIIFISLSSNLGFIKDFKPESWGKGIVLGPTYYFYMLHFIVYMGGAFLILTKKLLKSEGIEKTQLKFILSGTLLATLFGAFFNLFLPLYNYKFIWIGPYFTLAMVIAIAYAIVKHHLMNIKVIATEMFAGGIILVLLINLFTSQTANDWLLRAIVLGLGSVFSYLIIRSVIKEVTMREEKELLVKELAIANEKLKKLDEVKTEFLSIASHQLRSPITAIKGYSSMILEGSFGEINEKLKEVMDKIFQSSNRLVTMVGDFLDVSRIELGKMQYEFADFDIKELVVGVVEEFKANNKNQKIQISFESTDIDKINIKADLTKIRQVISNIIDNGLKYTTEGFIKVFLSQNTQTKTVLISIKDSGNGMDDDALATIFHKFARAKDASKSNTAGSGLGLYVANEMVKAHKGKVWAESDGIGKGSAFYIELPMSGNIDNIS